jgi:iron complex outermembrane receptor protein
MDLADRTLRLNGAIFTTDYDDLQFTYRAGVAPYLANAGKASIDGFELEMTWLPNDNWTINGGVGHLESSVDSLRDIAGTAPGVAVGNELPFAPEWQYNAGVAFNATFSNNWILTPRVDWSYRDDVFWDANNTPEISMNSSYSIINAAMVLGTESGPWRVRAAVTNVTDEEYSTGGNSSLTTGSGYAEIAYARPREYYVMFEYDF